MNYRMNPNRYARTFRDMWTPEFYESPSETEEREYAQAFEPTDWENYYPQSLAGADEEFILAWLYPDSMAALWYAEAQADLYRY